MLPKTLPGSRRAVRHSAVETEKGPATQGLLMRRRGLEPPPGYPGAGPQPGPSPAHSVHSAQNRDKPSTQLDDLDGSDAVDVLKAVLTSGPGASDRVGSPIAVMGARGSSRRGKPRRVRRRRRTVGDDRT